MKTELHQQQSVDFIKLNPPGHTNPFLDHKNIGLYLGQRNKLKSKQSKNRYEQRPLKL